MKRISRRGFLGRAGATGAGVAAIGLGLGEGSPAPEPVAAPPMNLGNYTTGTVANYASVMTNADSGVSTGYHNQVMLQQQRYFVLIGVTPKEAVEREYFMRREASAYYGFLDKEQRG